MYNSFGALSPDLADNGYCVYAFNYGQTLPLTGIYATGDIAASASQLATEVTGVLAETGASKVDIVGWSQGGMMPRYYINDLGGAAKVNMLVGLAPSNYGTTLDGLITLTSDFGTLGIATALLSVTCPACTEQIQGSPFLTSLNATPTVAGVEYVVIETADDEVVTPYTNAFLPAAGNVQNITLQNQCPQDHSDHLSIGYDSNALQDVVSALGPDSPISSRPAPQSDRSSGTSDRRSAGQYCFQPAEITDSYVHITLVVSGDGADAVPGPDRQAHRAADPDQRPGRGWPGPRSRRLRHGRRRDWQVSAGQGGDRRRRRARLLHPEWPCDRVIGAGPLSAHHRSPDGSGPSRSRSRRAGRG
jgi:pimeloyl-ACP methyl ester carboxylesterase